MKRLVVFTSDEHEAMEALLKDAIVELDLSKEIYENYHIRECYQKLQEIYHLYLTKEEE